MPQSGKNCNDYPCKPTQAKPGEARSGIHEEGQEGSEAETIALASLEAQAKTGNTACNHKQSQSTNTPTACKKVGS